MFLTNIDKIFKTNFYWSIVDLQCCVSFRCSTSESVSVTYIYIYVYMYVYTHTHMRSPGGSGSKESACNVGDLSSIPGSGRSPGKENGNPVQYSCLENTMDRRAWQATVHRVTKSQTQLSDFTFIYICVYPHFSF